VKSRSVRTAVGAVRLTAGELVVSSRSDEEIHRSGAWLPARCHNGGRELSVAGGHGVVDGQGIEKRSALTA
jgi:hypothetical protein